MAELSKFYDAIVAGKLEPAVEVTKEAIAEGVEPQVIINDYMVKAMPSSSRIISYNSSNTLK